MPQLNSIYNVTFRSLIVTTPAVIEPADDETIYVVALGCRPTSEWKPVVAQSEPPGAITGLDVTSCADLGRVSLRYDDADHPEHESHVWLMMDQWWGLHHVEPHASVARAGAVIAHLAERASSSDVSGIKALGDSIAAAEEAYQRYMSTTAPTKLPMAISMHGPSTRRPPGDVMSPPRHRKLHVERRESALGGPGALMPAPLEIELYLLSKRWVSDFETPT